MLHDLLLHPNTRRQLERFLQHPGQGLLITGDIGSGKRTLAEVLAAALLGKPVDELGSHPYFRTIDPESETISIDEIRHLQQFLKLKVPSKHSSIKRVIVVHNAERLRIEAQNAFLKTLEEPPADTCIILTVPRSGMLLPTIISRLNELPILPVSQADALRYFTSRGHDEIVIAKHYVLAQGQAGLMCALINDDAHPLITSVAEAKLLLSRPIGERLIGVEAVAKNKAETQLLIEALLRICRAALHTSSKQREDTVVKQWHDRQQVVLAAREYLLVNANTKLILDDLFLSL